MSEKNLPVDPRLLSLFPDEQPMSAEEQEALKQAEEKEDETVTKIIKVKKQPARRNLDTEKLPVKESCNQ